MVQILIHNTDKTFMVLPEAGSPVYDRTQFELVELANESALEAYIIEHELVAPPEPEVTDEEII